MPDTADLRTGAPLHDALLALLPLVGVWRGSGAGVVASSGTEFAYGQQIAVTHDGRPFLFYESRSWLVAADGSVIRQAWREAGFWRVGAGPDDIELVLASNTGQSLMFTGVAGDQQWELATALAVHTPTAVPVDGERRFYAVRGDAVRGDAVRGDAVRGDELIYATELAPGAAAVAGAATYAPHLNARLVRQPSTS